MHAEALRYKAERDLARQSTQHHIKRERELETILAHIISTAQQKGKCKCKTATIVRNLATELDPPRAIQNFRRTT